VQSLMSWMMSDGQSRGACGVASRPRDTGVSRVTICAAPELVSCAAGAADTNLLHVSMRSCRPVRAIYFRQIGAARMPAHSGSTRQPRNSFISMYTATCLAVGHATGTPYSTTAFAASRVETSPANQRPGGCSTCRKHDSDTSAAGHEVKGFRLSGCVTCTAAILSGG